MIQRAKRTLSILGFICAFVLMLCVAPFTSIADDTGQTGEINLDLSEDDGAMPYRVIQDNTIESFKKLAETATSLAQGGSASEFNFDQNSLSYLNAVYLYCSIQSGVCPLVLEAVLEVDVINSKISGTTKCPNMKRFWNEWVNADMEQRQKYQVKTSFINAHSQFTSQTRPKFLKCDATLTQMFEGKGSSENFFKARYRSGSAESKIFSTMVTLLTQLKEKVPNVFVATGSQQLVEEKKPGKKKSSGKTEARKVRGR